MTVLPTAVILAAGRGVRLGERTAEQPKPMTEVNGVSIVGNLFAALHAVGVEKAVLVTGYLSSVLQKHVRAFGVVPRVEVIENEAYATTNNIYSLWLAREHLREGFVLFEADIFLEPRLVASVMECPHEDVIVVDRFRPPMSGTVVELAEDGAVRAMHLKSDQAGLDLGACYKTVNIYRVSAAYAGEFLLPGLDAHICAGDVNSYYELVVKESIREGHVFHGLKTETIRWWEIDTEEDLRIAEEMFR